jgi:hypothetical protein
LGGKVSFKSTPETGTIFFVELTLKPLSLKLPVKKPFAND